MRDLNRLDSFLSQLVCTKVFMIAGNHDFIDEESAYLRYRFSADVHLFTERELTRVYEEAQNTYIYGLSYHSREITEPLYDGGRARERRRDSYSVRARRRRHTQSNRFSQAEMVRI